MWKRIVRVMYLESEVFSEIEHDQSATGQAALIAIAAALFSGVGSGFDADNFLSGFLPAVIWAFFAWILWSAVTLFIGTRIYRGESNMGEMLRVIGFAQAPRIFNIFSFIPFVGWAFPLIFGLWSLIAVFMGIREGLDIELFPTIVTVIVGWIIYIIGAYLIWTFTTANSIF